MSFIIYAYIYIYINYGKRERDNYFLHKFCARLVITDIDEPMLTMYRLVSGGGQHEELMPLVGEQRRVNFNRQLKVKR